MVVATRAIVVKRETVRSYYSRSVRGLEGSEEGKGYRVRG